MQRHLSRRIEQNIRELSRERRNHESRPQTLPVFSPSILPASQLLRVGGASAARAQCPGVDRVQSDRGD